MFTGGGVKVYRGGEQKDRRFRRSKKSSYKKGGREHSKRGGNGDPQMKKRGENARFYLKRPVGRGTSGKRCGFPKKERTTASTKNQKRERWCLIEGQPNLKPAVKDLEKEGGGAGQEEREGECPRANRG